MQHLSPLTSKINTDLSHYVNHDTFDVIVIGSGGAGFSAALNSAIDGARVLLVERTAHVGGTTALSASTSWIPGTQRGLKVNPDDTPERVATFLNHAVGDRSDPAMRQAFIDNGPKAVEKLERETALQFQVRQLHPDYLSELEGSVLRGRAIEPQPFDGKLLGPNMTLVRPPIPEFTVLGGMMVDRDDIFLMFGIPKGLMMSEDVNLANAKMTSLVIDISHSVSEERIAADNISTNIEKLSHENC